MNLTFEESDLVIKFLAHSDSVRFMLSTIQVEKVKAVWKDLHFYDSGHFYTFSEDFTVLKKENNPFLFPSPIQNFHKINQNPNKL